jgi:type I restriction enzyme S subunit
LSKGWPIVSMEEIFAIARGGSPRPIDAFLTDDPNGVNWVMISDATEGAKYINSTKKRIREEGVRYSRAVQPGDFLLTNSMSFGKPYIMNTSGCIHDGWLVLSPRHEDVSPDFFYYLLGSDFIYAEFLRRAAGATVKNLSIDLVKSIKVPLPPVVEQRRIAKLLDSAEALRAKRNSALAQLDSVTRSLFLDLFGDPSSNPKGFPTKPLASLVRDNDTINYGVVQPGEDLDEGIPLVRVGDLMGGKIRRTNLKRIAPSIEATYKRSRLRGDEILVSCVGSIGLVALADDSMKGFNIARAVARVPLAETTSRVFMAAYLSTNFVQRYFTNELRTVSQPTLNIKQLSETRVMLPPIDLQREFDRQVVAVENLKRCQRSSLVKMNSLFGSLQHLAFSGKL